MMRIDAARDIADLAVEIRQLRAADPEQVDISMLLDILETVVETLDVMERRLSVLEVHRWREMADHK